MQYSGGMPEEVYRSCASTMAFRRCSDTNGYKVLLVHKPRKRDAWQLPQGGCESGETVEQAALRELEEEAGITADCIGFGDDVYQYDFPASFRRFRPDNVKGQRVEYIIATVDDDCTVCVDGEEIDNHVWVEKSQLPKYLKRQEYLSLVQRLYDSGIANLTQS